MKLSSPTLLILALIAACSMPHTIVHAESSDELGEPICEFPPPNDICPIDRFEMSYPNGSGPPDYCLEEVGRKCIKRGLMIAPVPSWIHCRSLSTTSVSCTVWPHGDLHYDWAVSSGLQTANPPSWSGASQQVFCNSSLGSGMVSVTVTTPDNVSDTVFTSVSCGTIEY